MTHGVERLEGGRRGVHVYNITMKDRMVDQRMFVCTEIGFLIFNLLVKCATWILKVSAV